MDTSYEQVLALLAAGDWESAHQIVQEDGSTSGSWAHGFVHLMEGDRSNAGYWYRKAGRALPEEVDVAAEIKALARSLEGRSDGR